MDLGTDVGSPNVRTSWDYNYILKHTLDAAKTVSGPLVGDQLAIGKETGCRLRMGTNMYPSSALLGKHKDKSIVALPIDELIEKADGFAGLFPGAEGCLAKCFAETL
ncbi:hypothetical protein Tco_1065268 [Tanacetum coccineum]